MKKEIKKLLWVGIIAIVIIVGGIWAYNASQKANQPTADPKLLMNENNHTTAQGTRTYPITLVEFGDYQCPACAFVDPIVKKILTEKPEVKLVFRHFPLPGHEHAMLAAQAAEAAGVQGKFWEMHQAIYLNQEIWAKMKTPLDAFAEMAKQLNLDVEKFRQDVTSGKFVEGINKDRQDGIALGVSATPTFYINGRKYLGGNNYLTLKLAIEEAMQEASTQQTAPTAK